MTGVSYRSGGEVRHRGAEPGGSSDVREYRHPWRRKFAKESCAHSRRKAATRTKLLPDLPTMAEVGIPNAEANTFFGLVAPAGTPGEHRQDAQ